MIKALIITTSFPSSQNPSSGIFIKKFIDNLPGKIIPVVVTPDGRNNSFSVLDDKYEVLTFRYAPKKLQILTHQPGGLPVAFKNNKFLLLIVPMLMLSMMMTCIRKSKEIDIIHSNWSLVGLIGGLLGKFRSTRSIVTLRGADVNRSRSSFLSMLVLRFCVMSNDKVVTVSKAIEDYLIGCFPNYSHKFIMIPNGVDQSLIDYKITYKSETRHTVKLITVGSLIKRKNIVIQLNALSALKDKYHIELIIIGEGENKDSLQAKTETLKISDKVKFLGMRTHEDTIDIMKTVDIFILSSFSEGRPNVVLEAMALGLPIIASNIEGVAELVENDKTGLLFSPYDCRELVDSIESLIKDSTRLELLGRNAKKFIVDHKLTWENAAKKYAEVYKSLNRTKDC